jgi:hypothetical protein
MTNYKIVLNSDNDVIEFLNLMKKEEKVSKIVETDTYIFVDVNWAYKFEGHKAERTKFISLLKSTHFKYSPLGYYVREKDRFKQNKIDKVIERAYEQFKLN